MTVPDSLRWFFLALLAIIATLPEIYVVATTDNDTVIRVGVREAATRAFFFTPPSASSNSARQDDYEDYFEDMDDSTVTRDDVFGAAAASTPESAHSEKLSWPDSPLPPPPPPPADSDDLEPAPGQASLVIVFDGNMSGEWREFQREARNIIQELNAWDRIPIFNYIYVPVDGESLCLELEPGFENAQSLESLFQVQRWAPKWSPETRRNSWRLLNRSNCWALKV